MYLFEFGKNGFISTVLSYPAPDENFPKFLPKGSKKFTEFIIGAFVTPGK